jgi:hypothetical protein
MPVNPMTRLVAARHVTGLWNTMTAEIEAEAGARTDLPN